MNYEYRKYSYKSRTRRKLRRSRDGVIWGVCKGFANWLEAPVGIVRIIYLTLMV
ncbi:PspC domain-containing protein, partial [bacterium]|nr:PspC domain-containing protein [bacterium]